MNTSYAESEHRYQMRAVYPALTFLKKVEVPMMKDTPQRNAEDPHAQHLPCSS